MHTCTGEESARGRRAGTLALRAAGPRVHARRAMCVPCPTLSLPYNYCAPGGRVNTL